MGGIFLPVGGAGWAVKQKGSPGGKSLIFHRVIPLDLGASALSCQGFKSGRCLFFLRTTAYLKMKAATLWDRLRVQ